MLTEPDRKAVLDKVELLEKDTQMTLLLAVIANDAESHPRACELVEKFWYAFNLFYEVIGSPREGGPNVA